METKEVKPRNPVQILLSRTDNMRNDIALIRQRVEGLEKSIPTLKDYIKDQMIELYSQIEAARETMDEITAFFEEMNREEYEEDESTQVTEEKREKWEAEHQPDYLLPDIQEEVTELELSDVEMLPGYDDGQSLSGDEQSSSYDSNEEGEYN